MKNIPLPRENYIWFRNWLRSTEIVWRDVTDSAMVYQWNEAITREDILDENGKTPGERAWLTIRTTYPNLDLRWRNEELELLNCKSPKYFKSAYHGPLYVADVQSAYSQIYSRLSFHSDYPFKRLKYPLKSISEKLSADKLGRNAVVGIARSTRNKWVQGEKVWYTKKHNPFLSPTLWAQIQMILTAAARIAIDEGAFFVNTDGYAFQTAQERDKAVSRLNTFGLGLSTTEGQGEILGISCLHIPEKKVPAEFNPSKPTYWLEPDDNRPWLEWWSKLS